MRIVHNRRGKGHKNIHQLTWKHQFQCCNFVEYDKWMVGKEMIIPLLILLSIDISELYILCSCLEQTIFMLTLSNGIFSALLAICVGNSTFTGEFTKASDALWCFLGLLLEKWLSKHAWGYWFETPSRPLWRHCNVQTLFSGTSLALSQARNIIWMNNEALHQSIYEYKQQDREVIHCKCKCVYEYSLYVWWALQVRIKWLIR